MTASPDDAAASAVPPRADGGPAAPSFPGTPGRRPPEDSPMSQRPTLTDDRLPDDTVKYEPVPDETVRMRADGPAPDGGPAVRPVDAAEDTRPVTRDWLLGAPDTDPGPGPSPAPSTAAHQPPAPVAADAEADDWDTETLDPPPDVTAPAKAADATTTLAAVPDEVDGDGPETPGGPPPGDEPPAGGPRGPW